MRYSLLLRTLLSSSESRILKLLISPQKIQDYLDTLPINFETRGETYMSPRRVLRYKTAHCLEGALFAATALAYHGKKPLLMDFQTSYDDEDHVIALFRQNGLWGAVSKTNHAILRYRDPIYRTPRELALSFFHEYFTWDGRKSLKAFSAPYDLSRHKPEQWVTEESDLEWLVEALDKSKHFPVVSKRNARYLRCASKIEIDSLLQMEWSKGNVRSNRSKLPKCRRVYK